MNAAIGSNERILLVGDGDFSFTLSLTNYLPPSCLVGTNLETEESIQKHKNAQDNIKELLDKGAHLILGVDARQLNIHPQVGEQYFKRIIFNFPHIGGKSNNKKNRALLNDFFKSAAGVLSPEGEVMVTLCRGQGGTVADQPQRLWADSWQIVSMAANSGFILTQVVPFEAEIYPRYSCTGFRSQDKGFHLEGSLTHIFQRRDAVPVPQNVTPLPVILNRNEFLCPTYLHSKISSYRNFMKNPDHPFKQTQDNLISELEKVKTLEILRKDQLPCVMERSDLSASSPELAACRLEFLNSLEGESEALSTSDNGKSTTISSDNLASPNNVLKSLDNQPVFKDGAEYYFRTSLIENIPLLLESENLEKQQYLLTSGLTFTQGVISPGFIPVSIELLGLTKCGIDENEVTEKDIHETLSRSLKTSCSVFTDFASSAKETQPTIKIKNIIVEFTTKIICKNLTEDLCIGYILKISNQNDNDFLFWGFLISIDKLTEIRFSVEHKGILWRENIGQFLNPQFPSDTVDKYKPISTFPLEFVHDMSFWENADLAFDENQFSCIVRDIAADCVTSVKLIDTYQEPETERTGRCYRIIFQSWDLCLSYKTSWELQSLIRLATAEKMSITLR